MQSMTGYGHGKHSSGEVEYQVEARSLNHRYLDINIRLPQPVAALEENIREQVRLAVQRGRLDILVSRRQSQGQTIIQVDEELAQDYVRVVRHLSCQFALPVHLTAEALVAMPGVVSASAKEIQLEQEWQRLSPALAAALSSLQEQRRAEGSRLQADMSHRLQLIGAAVDEIEAISPRAAEEYRRRVEQRITQLLGEVPLDQNRLLTETAILAERISITEELVRLRSHCQALVETLESPEPAGRKIDFILQEMNREVNTISSKSQDYQIAKLVIEIKSQLEKLREQGQNIE